MRELLRIILLNIESIGTETIKAMEDVTKMGVKHEDIGNLVKDHLAELPAKIRGLGNGRS